METLGDRTQIQLTPKQKECVDYTPEQHLLVRGIAGSGKTTVLIERARRLQSLRTLGRSKSSVLVLTYNRALATYMGRLCEKTGTDSIPVKTFHGMAGGILHVLGVSPQEVLSGRRREMLIEQAVLETRQTRPGHRLFAQPIDFWDEEIQWMKGHCVLDIDTYRQIERTGRGTSVRVTADDRFVIFDVFERYQRALHRGRFMDYDDFANVLIEHMDEIPEEQRIDHLLIDEAQDLHESQLLACAGLCNVALTIAADKAQNIYRTGFSWSSVGIDIRGRSKLLDNTHRSTREIVTLAASLQMHDPIAKRKDEEYVPASPPDKIGPLPVLFTPSSAAAELNLISKLARELLRMTPKGSVGIVARTHQRIMEIGESLRRSNLTPEIIRSDQGDVMSPGVKLTTFHSAKGLEFDHVIVTGLSEGILPEREPMDSVDEDLEEWLAVERRLLYVAMTRARESLILIAPNPQSRFIREMDSSLYEDGGRYAV